MVPQAKARTAQFPGAGAASFELLESKLLIPSSRPGIVARAALAARLTGPDAPPITTVVAPAGYGKTTLLAQWAEPHAPNVAWVSLDDADNDPAVLLTYIAVALDRVEAIGARVFRALATPTNDVAVVRTLLAAMAAMTEPVVLVLDQVDVITNPEGQAAIDAFATHLPPGARLALGSRAALPIPAARLRAEGRIAEIGTPDLAMEEAEAGLLLRGAGAECTDADVQELVLGTEGWPTGLYLAAMGMRVGAPGGDGRFALSGDERFLGDYLRSELLERASPEVAQFVTRASVLDRMCGPLCDAVLDTEGSARMLDYLESRNLLLVPLDRTRQWFRFHHLFRDLLRTELQRTEPDLVPVLNARAAAWCEANGLPETAIAYAQQAGDADTVARIFVNIVQPVWASGRVDTVLQWMQWLYAQSSIDRYPAVALHGALIYAMLGQASTAEDWAAAAESAPDTGMLPDGNTVHASLAYLRALLCRRGIPEMLCDAQTAWKELNPASPYRATMLNTEAVASLITGDHDQADPLLARAFDAAMAAGALRSRRWCWPSAASWPSTATTGPTRRHFRIRRWRCSTTASSTATGPARWSTRSRRVPRCSAATSRRRARWRPAPRRCARCSPTRCRWCRCRRCSSSPASTSPWATSRAPRRRCAR